MPSLFSMSGPVTVFQVWFIVYVYMLPILLYATWAGLSLMDMAESKEGGGWAAVAVIVLPLAGGAWYLLARARTLTRPARLAAVVTGLIVWFIPVFIAIWLVGRPLGPKALG